MLIVSCSIFHRRRRKIVALQSLTPLNALTGIAAPHVATSPSADRCRGGVLIMNKSAWFKRSSLMITVIAVSTLYAGAWRAEADFIQTNLVSDLAGLNAAITEPELVNPWGISHTATSPIWTFEPGYQYSHSLRGDERQ